MARPTVGQGAKQGGGPAGAVGEMFDQMGGGGFAIGAGNADQGQLATGLAPEGGGQAPGAFRHRISHHQHRIPWAGGILGRGPRANYRGTGAGLQGRPPETTAIHPGPRQADEQGARPHPPRITGHIANHWIR